MFTRRTTLLAIAAVPLLARAGSAQTVRSGTFEGASRHVTTGTARIVVESGAARVELAEDFTFDGAPDPKVALGRDGYDKDTLLAPLASNSGAQSYPVPAAIDVASYTEVWIWCERFNVPLGVARLTD